MVYITNARTIVKSSNYASIEEDYRKKMLTHVHNTHTHIHSLKFREKVGTIVVPQLIMTSSLCPQLSTPTPLWEQSISLVSEGLQVTSSNQIGWKLDPEPKLQEK